ncbi:MAG: hypothetical protein QOG41_1704 [Thermoleophilaceae bacterium]|jgi:hypothetical protein|nr:hypothetical protein [Thermoleophilaceae bacterium]
MAQGVAGARIVFGIAFMTMPGWTGRVWIGRDADRHAVKILTQAIGARDLTMGLGALIAMRNGRGARGWFQAISLTDVFDFTCALLAKEVLPPAQRAMVLALAGGSAAQAAYASTGVED